MFNVCNNCGKKGHMYQNCKFPINSYGVIAYKKDQSNIQYLMICRKDTYGYIDLIRGKYNVHNVIQVQKIIDEMSIVEKIRLKYLYDEYLHCDEEKRTEFINVSFRTLWIKMWDEANEYRGEDYNDNITAQNIEEINSLKKYEILMKGWTSPEYGCVNMGELIGRSTTCWEEPEWEFPKGRKNNIKEQDIYCALREFEEETGIKKRALQLIQNVLPFEETIIGTNYKTYKHYYFLAELVDDNNTYQNFQKNEVSKVCIKPLNECLGKIRNYNFDRKKILMYIDKLLKDNCTYSVV